MDKDLYLRGPVAKRTRNKEAEFYRQLHCAYKKKKVEINKSSESVRCGGVKKRSPFVSCRNVSGFSGDSGKEDLEFLETDKSYEIFLRGIKTNIVSGDVSSNGNGNDLDIDKASETNNCSFSNLMGVHANSVGDENDGRINFESLEDSSDNLQFETKECGIVSEGENDGGLNSYQASENDSGNQKLENDLVEKQQSDSKLCCPLKFTSGIEESSSPKQSEHDNELDKLGDEMDIALCEPVTENTTFETKECVGDENDGENNSETSEDSRDNLQFEAKECVIISDEENDGGVNSYQASENDSGNLKLERKVLEKHDNVSDIDSAGDDKDDVSSCETSGDENSGNLQRQFQFHKADEGNLRDDDNGERNDHDVEACEISDECVEDLDKEKPSKLNIELNIYPKRKGGSSKKKATRRKHNRTPRETGDAAKILADFVSENLEIPCEEGKQQPHSKPGMPLKFTFGIKESIPPTKSEPEKELDELWDEMGIALCEVVTENTMPADGEVSEVEVDRDVSCDRGDHCFIIDEEIGLKCKHCSFVRTEIRYLTVPFLENHLRRSGGRGCFTVEHDTSEDFHYDDMANNSGSTSDPNNIKQGTVWDIIPGIDNGMHKHQKEGFEFIWKNIAGDIFIERMKEGRVGDGGGCVISHAPGTGKTRLTIAFLQTYLKQYPLCRALIIAPSGMLPTWEAEFLKWNTDIPFHNLNSSDLLGKQNMSALKFASKHNSVKKEKLTRMVKLCSWVKGGSILGMSYRLFQDLTGAVGNSNTKLDEAENIRRILLEHTGLIVLDEGHTARNQESLIWQALSKVRTEKRIILSGTPFQNNFDELYNILWLVRPKFAEKIQFKRHKLSKRRGRKKNEAREVWGSLTEQISTEKDDILKAQTLAKLKKAIKPFVHVHKGNILQEKLPGLRESLIVLEPCQLQKNLLLDAEKLDLNSFGKEHMISVLSVHPSLLLDIEFDLQEFSGDLDELKNSLRRHRLNPEVGIKTKFLMVFIRLCQAVNERVLIFSQYINPLSFIKEQLKSKFRWSEAKEILSIHGNLEVDKRQQQIKDFNDPKSEAKVLLASTRACSEGINLVGASRVVLLDVVWNPSVERQAISRAYRLGQERVVHIYHLITSGTMEEEKYCRQAEKDRLSDLLFCAEDKADDIVEKTHSDHPDGKRDMILKHMIDHEKLQSMFKKIIQQPKCTNLIESFGFVE